MLRCERAPLTQNLNCTSSCTRRGGCACLLSSADAFDPLFIVLSPAQTQGRDTKMSASWKLQSRIGHDEFPTTYSSSFVTDCLPLPMR
jgi:hypothetical protein